MKPAPFKTKHVYLELLDADFLFVQSEPNRLLDGAKKMIAKDRLAEFEKKLETNEIKATVKGRTFFMNGGGSVIWLRTDDPQYLLHECIHAVHWLLQERNMPLSDDNDELYAYLICWLFKKAV